MTVARAQAPGAGDGGLPAGVRPRSSGVRRGAGRLLRAAPQGHAGRGALQGQARSGSRAQARSSRRGSRTSRAAPRARRRRALALWIVDFEPARPRHEHPEVHRRAVRTTTSIRRDRGPRPDAPYGGLRRTRPRARGPGPASRRDPRSRTRRRRRSRLRGHLRRAGDRGGEDPVPPSRWNSAARPQPGEPSTTCSRSSTCRSAWPRPTSRRWTRTGAAGSSPNYRGKVVVLDFWGILVTPLPRDAPAREGDGRSTEGTSPSPSSGSTATGTVTSPASSTTKKRSRRDAGKSEGQSLEGIRSGDAKVSRSSAPPRRRSARRSSTPTSPTSGRSSRRTRSPGARRSSARRAESWPGGGTSRAGRRSTSSTRRA